MIIERVELRNFRSHRQTDVEFDRGVNVIVGENGAGKTSILEAINFALFRETPKRVKMSELISRGAESDGMKVALTLQANGKKLMVERSRGRASTDKLFADGTMVTGDEKESQTTREIEKSIHMDMRLFTNAVYIRQGEIDALLSQDPAQRKRLIGKLIGTEDLENAWDSMPSVVSGFEKKAEENRLVEEQMAEAKKRASEAESRRSSLSNELSQISGRLKVENEKFAQAKSRADELAKLDDDISKALDLSKDIKRAKETLAHAEEYKGRMEKSKADYGRYLELKVELEALEDVASGERAAIEEARAKWEVKLGELRDAISGKKGGENEVRKAASKLDEAKDKCPICSQELTEEHKKKVLAEYEIEMKRVREERTKLEKSLEEMEGRAAQEHENAIKELKVKSNAIKDERRKYESSYKEYIAAEGFLKEFASKEDKLKDDVTMFEDELVRKWESVEENSKKFGLHETLKNTPREERPPLVRRASKEIQRDLDALYDGLKRLEREQGRLEGELTGLGRDIERYKAEVASLEARAKENEKLLRFIALLNEIRMLFDKDHLQRELRARHRPRIERYTREHFENFNLAYTDVTLTDDYSLLVYDASGERSADMLSGGERIAAALALRFGIANDLLESASAMELMILDEPTIHLDEQRRQELVEMVKHLSSIPQTIVVTHDTEFEAAADKLILIRKEDGVSKVEYRGG